MMSIKLSYTNLLGNFRSGNDTGSDSPDRLVGNDNLGPVLSVVCGSDTGKSTVTVLENIPSQPAMAFICSKQTSLVLPDSRSSSCRNVNNDRKKREGCAIKDGTHLFTNAGNDAEIALKSKGNLLASHLYNKRIPKYRIWQYHYVLEPTALDSP